MAIWLEAPKATGLLTADPLKPNEEQQQAEAAEATGYLRKSIILTVHLQTPSSSLPPPFYLSPFLSPRSPFLEGYRKWRNVSPTEKKNKGKQ